MTKEIKVKGEELKKKGDMIQKDMRRINIYEKNM